MKTLRTFFRALVMAVALAVVAMWGLSGWPMPPAAHQLAGRLSEWTNQLAARSNSSDAPPPSAPEIDTGRQTTGAAPPVWKVNGPADAPSPGAVAPLPMESPPPFAEAAPLDEAARSVVQASATSGDADDRVRLAAGTGPAEPPDVLAAGATDGVPASDASNQSDTVLAAIGRQLRNLGATEYALERWDGQAPLYRFTCEVAIADNADFHRHFEATESSPYVAMSQVLSQVKSWRDEAAQ